MHRMMFALKDEDGFDRFVCLDCDRQVNIQWFPWKKIVIVEGDTEAGHSGGIGGLLLSGTEVSPNG